MFTPLQRFFRLLSPNRKTIRNLYLFAIINGMIALSLPLGIQSIINLIQGGEISASWILLVAIVLAGYLITGMIQVVQLQITENLQKDLFTRSAFEFAYRIPRIRMDALHQHYAPELMNRFFDTITLQKGVAKVLLDFTAAGLQILFGLILLSFYHPFFIIFSFIVLFLVLIIGRYVFSRGLKSSIMESKYKYKVAFWLEEIARTNTTFRLSCETSLPILKTDKLVDSYLDARGKHFNIILRHYYIFIIFQILVASGFLVMGSILVFNQQMNIGQFVASEIIVLLLLSSSERLLKSMETVYDLLTSLEKIGQVTDLPLENTDNTLKISDTIKEKGVSLAINDITFTYPDSTIPVLEHISLNIDAGEKVCISGGNGSGKSSLLKLLTRFYEPDKGTILCDNVPIVNYDVMQLRGLIAACISDDRIFEGTLLENLTIGREMDTDKIYRVLELTGLVEFLHQLPEGYQSMIGPQSKRITSSTAQKLILARNLLKEPGLLIVEDIFNNLEAEEKRTLFRNILSPENKLTVIVVSRDPAIQAMTDRLITLKNGRISEIKSQEEALIKS
jgi:ABC-type bacteriocin/lantibiotic exporter with double-glycine peptidase domain